MASGPVRLALAVMLVAFLALLAGGLFASQRHDDLLANQTALQWRAVQANNAAHRLSILAERYFAGDTAVSREVLKSRYAVLIKQLNKLREGPAGRDLLAFEGLENRIGALEAELNGLGTTLTFLDRDDLKASQLVRTCLENAVLALTDAVTVAVRRLSGPQTVSYWGNLLNILYVSIGVAGVGLIFLTVVVIAENGKNGRLAERYKTAMALADSANLAKSRLLANVSHELRTPLNAIIGFSDVLNDQIFGNLGNDRYREYSGYIRDSGTHLLMLVNDLLDYARHDEGGLPLRFEPLPLVEVLLDAVRATAPDAEERRVALDLESPFFPIVLADPRALRQIATKLIGNAVRHSPEGAKVEVTFSIQTGVSAHGDTVVVHVLDRGPELPAKEAERLLRPFERLQTDSFVAGQDSGAGLGLALAHKLAEKHGGGVSLNRREGGGTDASFSLPLVRNSGPGAGRGTVVGFTR